MGNALRFTPEQYAAHLARMGAREAEPAPAKPTGKERLQALGRLKDGEMNATEARFEREYLEPRKAAGEIKWYAFELIKIKLAKNTHLTVDFFVLNDRDELQAYDIKGSRAVVTDDALAKTKIAAQMCPWPFFLAFPVKGGGWEIERIGI